MNIDQIMQGLEDLGVFGSDADQGEGWFTTSEAARAVGKSAPTTQRYLRDLVHSGKLECSRVKRKQIDGVVKPVTAYRFVGVADESAGAGVVESVRARPGSAASIKRG